MTVGDVNVIAGRHHFFVVKADSVQKLHSSVFKIVYVDGVVDMAVRVAFVSANDKV